MKSYIYIFISFFKPDYICCGWRTNGIQHPKSYFKASPAWEEKKSHRRVRKLLLLFILFLRLLGLSVFNMLVVTGLEMERIQITRRIIIPADGISALLLFGDLLVFYFVVKNKTRCVFTSELIVVVFKNIFFLYKLPYWQVPCCNA